MTDRVAIVLIGRNEGLRFQRSLASALAASQRVVYVDSGSTDGSPAHARERGAVVHELDMSLPFTAARARNQGLREVLALPGPVEFVQFIDGDCELVDTWLPAALAALQQTPGVAVVCGRRRETHPERSLYNRLCDLEWNTPVGAAKACGGDALFRVSALTQVGGYLDGLIAGEEPELCVRLRAAGWAVQRIDEEMTRHDAAMTQFAQWWKRAQRAGHAFAEGHALHGQPPERHYRRECLRAWLWAGALPLLALLGAWAVGPWALLLLLAYPLQVLRQALQQAPTAPLRWWYPAFTIIGKFAELQGQLVYFGNRLRGRKARIMEYKT